MVRQGLGTQYPVNARIFKGGAHVLQCAFSVRDIPASFLFLFRRVPPGRCVELTQQFRCLVQQWNVSLSPGCVLRTVEKLPLGVAEVRCRRFKLRGLGEQVPQQLFRSHRHPGEVQRDPHVPGGADVFGEVGAVGGVSGTRRFFQLFGQLLREFAQHDLHEGCPCLVVRFAGSAGAVPGPADLPRRQGENAAFNVELPVLGRDALAVGDRLLDDTGHVQAALEGRDLFRGLLDGLDARHQAADACHHNTRFAQGGQHPLDVLHECVGWADQQNTR